MKIVVGGYYVDRDGETLKIDRIDREHAFGLTNPYMSGSRSYQEDGRYSTNPDPSDTCAIDLIREATPDEVIAYSSGADALPPTLDEVFDPEFVPGVEGVARPEAHAGPGYQRDIDDLNKYAPRTCADVTSTEIDDDRAYADLFAEPESVDHYNERVEIEIAIGRSVAFRNRASGIMQIMLGIAAIFFAASGYQ